MTDNVPKTVQNPTDSESAFRAVEGILAELPKLEALEVIQKLLNQYLSEPESRTEIPKPEKAKRITRGRLSKIQRDGELETFLLDNLSNTSQKDLLDKCIKHFGAERAPSKSALSRFLIDAATKGKTGSNKK